MARYLWVAMVVITALLTACTSIAPPVDSTISTQIASTPAQAFRLEGRLSVRQAQKLDSVSVVWQKSSTTQTIDVTGPLGIQVAQIIQREGQIATLSRGDAVPIERAETVDALLAQALGIRIRLEKIIAWTELIGLPVNGEVIAMLVDDTEWLVSAETTQQLGGQTIARRLVARAGDVTIKLFVDNWQKLDQTLK
jgi:outer membrane biogenesis lipoprotein LolB